MQRNYFHESLAEHFGSALIKFHIYGRSTKNQDVKIEKNLSQNSLAIFTQRETSTWWKVIMQIPSYKETLLLQKMRKYLFIIPITSLQMRRGAATNKFPEKSLPAPNSIGRLT